MLAHTMCSAHGLVAGLTAQEKVDQAELAPSKSGMQPAECLRVPHMVHHVRRSGLIEDSLEAEQHISRTNLAPSALGMQSDERSYHVHRPGLVEN